MSKRDYYQVLDVPKNATEADIKKAYRRLAMKYHPDRNPDAESEEKFKEAKEACEVLTDPQKRAAYDQFGHAGVEAARRRAGGGGFTAADVFGEAFGEVFGDIFGGRRGGRSQVFRGADLRYDLELELHQAVFGDSLEIDFHSLSECETCKGSGAAKDSKFVNCETCDGHGQVRVSQGFFSVQHTCPRCKGQGQTIGKPCDSCHGQGRVQRPRKFTVKVPGGVDTGDRIRLAGEGEAGRNGGPRGDLYVEIHVRAHPIFERDGSHLSCEVPISFATAVLGGEIEVPTLDGHVVLKVPAETQAGRVFRLREKGVRPVRGGSTGDLFCKVAIETPVNLSAEQRKLVSQLEESLKHDRKPHNPREQNWLAGMKKFFENLKN